MSLQALLVSRDAGAVSVLQTVMRNLDVESEVCADLQPAVERLAEGATSAVVVDYDVEHATRLLQLVRQNYAGSCVALAMVKGLTSIQSAYDMGANFVLIKPVTPDAASRSLGEAAALVERMIKRPARLAVPTLAYVSFDGVNDPAIILDIGEGGMAIQALQPLEANGPLQLRFDLPGSLDTLNFKAEIIWADSSGRAGLRFLEVSEDALQQLRDWVRINAAAVRTPTTPSPEPLEDHPPAAIEAAASSAVSDVKARPISATVAQRIFSTMVDASLVLLGTLVFLATFWAYVRHLPASSWALPGIALVVPFVFWVVYLYLFLGHPKGTPGMQMAEERTAAADRPEIFSDLVPPSPLVSASTRILTWLENRCTAASKTPPAADVIATPGPPMTPTSSDRANSGIGLSQP